MKDIEALSQSIEAAKAPFIELSDCVWETPEIRYQEKNSVEAHIALTEKEDFRVTRNIGDIPTAFIGEAGSGSPVIAFMGEFDALAGLSQQAGTAEQIPVETGGHGHGCGHHLLGSASLLAAKAARDYLAKNNLPGTVRYYGCPAEEGGSGKVFMARAGAFDDVDAAVSWHPGSFNAVLNAKSLSNVQVYFRFKGRASHAGGAPHLGRSALDAVELMSVGVQYMREHMPDAARVHAAIINTGGISPNVVQADAEVLYLIRSPEIEDVWPLFERVKKIATGASLMTETEVEWEIDRACTSLLPNHVLAEAMDANMKKIGAPAFDDLDRAYARKIQGTLTDEDVKFAYRSRGLPVELDKPIHDGIVSYEGAIEQSSGSTDVGDISWMVPTMQCWTACNAIGTPGHSWQMVAQGKSPIAHKGMVLAAKTMAALGIDLFTDPDLLARATVEFKERVGEEGYTCPIPDDVLAPCHRGKAA